MLKLQEDFFRHFMNFRGSVRGAYFNCGRRFHDVSLKTLQNVLDKTKQEKYILSFLLKVLSFYFFSEWSHSEDLIFNLQLALSWHSKGSWILWAAEEDTINDISDKMDKKLKIQDDSWSWSWRKDFWFLVNIFFMTNCLCWN